MEYWTFLVITLAAPLDGYVSVLPYQGMSACNAAMEVVPATLSFDVEMVQCIQTETPTWTVRPMKRPENLNE